MGIAFIIIMSYNMACGDNLQLYKEVHTWGKRTGYHARNADTSIL